MEVVFGFVGVGSFCGWNVCCVLIHTWLGLGLLAFASEFVNQYLFYKKKLFYQFT